MLLLMLMKFINFFLAKNTNNTSLFKRAFIPLNSRAKTSKPDCPINDNGIPLCPKNNSLEMKPNGYSHKRGCYIWVCPKRNANRICSCENPCTNSKYGRVCNVYPAKILGYIQAPLEVLMSGLKCTKSVVSLNKQLIILNLIWVLLVEKLEMLKLLKLTFFLLALLNFYSYCC